MNVNILRHLEKIEEELQGVSDARRTVQNINIVNFIAPVYAPIHKEVMNDKYQYYNLTGGRGSGKSSFISLEIVNGIQNDETGESNAIVFRRYATTLRESVFTQIAWAIDVLGVSDLWESKLSPMRYVYKPTGAEILIRGLDDASKLKSIKARRGYFRYVWIEEFNELQGERFTRKVMQSVLRGGETFTVFRSFNPPQSQNNWANILVNRADDRSLHLHTDYTDMPSEWLGSAFIEEAERLKAINVEAYNNEYMGLVTGTGGEVFPNVVSRTITDEEIEGYSYFYAGIDWGFSVDPAAFLYLAYDSKTDTLLFIDEICETKLSNKKFAEKIKAKGYQYQKGYEILNGEVYKNKQLIIADSAEPKSIADMQEEGLKVIACRKYPGCVNYRIKWLQHRRIIIDAKRTPNAYEEFINYHYAMDKDGNFLSEVPDKDNHMIDCCAYCCDRLIYRKGVSA